jgi:hypothetical protein
MKAATSLARIRTVVILPCLLVALAACSTSDQPSGSDQGGSSGASESSGGSDLRVPASRIQWHSDIHADLRSQLEARRGCRHLVEELDSPGHGAARCNGC